MKHKKLFMLAIRALIIVGFILSCLNEDKLMMLFFVLAMILQELEDVHYTLKVSSKNKE